MDIKEKDGVFWLGKGKLEMFTPQRYMGSTNLIKGDTVNAIGLCMYKYYNNPSDKKPAKVGVFKNPSTCVFYPTDIEQNVLDTIWEGIYKDLNENEYTKMTFLENTRVMNKYVVQNLNNVTTFTNLFLEGNIDNNIPYQMLSSIFIKNMTMNHVNLDVPAVVINLLIMKLCRDKHDKTKLFAQVLGKDPKHCPIAYTFIKTREICAADSVFSGLSFEDMNSMLDSSLNMTKDRRSQTISPLEQIMKM